MRYALVPLVTALALIIIGRRPLALLVFFGYLSIEGTLKLLSNYFPLVHVGADLVLHPFVAFWLFGAVATRSVKVPSLPWFRLLAAYVVWVLLQLFNPYRASLFVGLAALKIHLSMIPLYILAFLLVKDRRDLVRILAGLTLIGLVPFLAALSQYAAGPQSVLDLSPRFRENIALFHEWRPFGTSAMPGGASVFAFLTTPLAMALLLMPKKQLYAAAAGSPEGAGASGGGPPPEPNDEPPSGWLRVARLLAVVSLLLASATFIVSGGRQMLLGCLLALMVMGALLLSRGRSRGVMVLLVLAVLFGTAYYGVKEWLQPMATQALLADPTAPEIWRSQSVITRIFTLAQTATYFTARQGGLYNVATRAKKYPLGAGLGRTGSAGGALAGGLSADPLSERVQRDVGFSDNFFADILAETGIPGALMITTIMIGMLVLAVRLARGSRDPLHITAAAAIAGMLFAILVMSWGSQPLLSNPITAYFWFLCGILACIRRGEAELTAAEAAAEEKEGAAGAEGSEPAAPAAAPNPAAPPARATVRLFSPRP